MTARPLLLLMGMLSVGGPWAPARADDASAAAVALLPNAQPRLSCVPWHDSGPVPTDAVPWRLEPLSALGAAIRRRPPHLQIYDDRRARPIGAAWYAQHANGLFAAVDVHDDVPVAAQRFEALDAGDAVELRLRIGLSEHGARALGAGAETTDARDFALLLAHTAAGPKASFKVLEGRPCDEELTGHVHIERPPGPHITRYEVLLPWHLLRAAPGAVGAVGAGVLLHARRHPAEPKRTFRAFIDAGGGLRPDALLSLALPAPPPPYAAISPIRRRQHTAGDGLLWRVRGHAAVASLQASHGPWRANCPLGDGPFDVAVRIVPPSGGEPDAGAAFTLEASMADERILARRTDTPVATWQALHAARARLRALEGAGPGRGRARSHERAARHAATLRALLERERAAADMGSAHEQEARIGALERLCTAIAQVPLSARDEPWQTDLAQGRRAYIEAAFHPGDRTLAPGALFVPTRPVAPGQKRPLVVFLHGRGQPDLAHFLAHFVEESDDGLADAFVLVPWARGNYGVQQTSEGDVLALVDAMLDRYPVDADAVSLTGFSLGGTGAFALALHAPARFSAVAIASGGTWQVPLGQGLGRNVAHVPFFLWHGGADGIVPVQEQNLIIAELNSGGATYEAHVETVAGHTLSRALRSRMIDFVMNKRRAPAHDFAYVADGPYQRGRSGIALRYDARRALFPSLTARRRGHERRIETQGSDGLEIAPAALGPDPAEKFDIALPTLSLSHCDAAPRAVGMGAARP